MEVSLNFMFFFFFDSEFNILCVFCLFFHSPFLIFSCILFIFFSRFSGIFGVVLISFLFCALFIFGSSKDAASTGKL